MVLLAAVLFSTGGAAIKATDLSNWQIAAFRSSVAAVFLAVAAGRQFRISGAVLLVGAAQAATQISFVTANKLTTAANSVFFQGTAPLYIALLGPWLLGERLARRDYPVLGAIAAGIVLLFADPGARTASAPDPFVGNTIGALSGFCWSLTVIGLRWISRRDPMQARSAATSSAVVASLIVMVACLPAAWPAPRATAGDVSMLLLAEPACSPVWAWLVHGERPGAWPLAGGLLIVGATAWKTWQDAAKLKALAAQRPQDHD